jgi:hypothetical protein
MRDARTNGQRLPDCKPANALFLADRPQRLDMLELREFEANVRRQEVFEPTVRSFCGLCNLCG